MQPPSALLHVVARAALNRALSDLNAPSVLA